MIENSFGNNNHREKNIICKTTLSKTRVAMLKLIQDLSITYISNIWISIEISAQSNKDKNGDIILLL